MAGDAPGRRSLRGPVHALPRARSGRFCGFGRATCSSMSSGGLGGRRTGFRSMVRQASPWTDDPHLILRKARQDIGGPQFQAGVTLVSLQQDAGRHQEPPEVMGRLAALGQGIQRRVGDRRVWGTRSARIFGPEPARSQVSPDLGWSPRRVRPAADGVLAGRGRPLARGGALSLNGGHLLRDRCGTRLRPGCRGSRRLPGARRCAHPLAPGNHPPCTSSSAQRTA